MDIFVELEKDAKELDATAVRLFTQLINVGKEKYLKYRNFKVSGEISFEWTTVMKAFAAFTIKLLTNLHETDAEECKKIVEQDQELFSEMFELCKDQV